jgi:hypothetical protein
MFPPVRSSNAIQSGTDKKVSRTPIFNPKALVFPWQHRLNNEKTHASAVSQAQPYEGKQPFLLKQSLLRLFI